MAPPEQKPDFGKTLAEAGRASAIEALRERYFSEDEVDFVLRCSAPGGFAREACERLQINEGWSTERERVKLLVHQYKEHLFDAILKRVTAQETLQNKTKDELETLANVMEAKLQESHRLVTTMGQMMKLRRTSYSQDAAEEPMDTEEIIALRQFMEGLQQIDADELVDMVFEDKEYIDILVDRTILDEEKDNYWKTIEHLVDFISGLPEQMPGESKEKQKSRFRTQSETLVWQEIVRGMNFNQKRDLVAKFIEMKGVKPAREFIAGCIIARALNRDEMQHMYSEGKDPPAMHSDMFSQLGNDNDFEAFLRDSVKAKDSIDQMIQEEAASIESPQIQNSVTYFFTFNKIGAETVGRVGAIAALVNLGMNISDRIKSRAEGQSWLSAAAYGVADAVKNPYVLGGVAAALAASNIIHPWMKDWLHKPSKQEQEKIEHFHEEQIFLDQARNHREVTDYLIENYDDFMKKAWQNERVRGSFDLCPQDVKISENQAREFGYSGPVEAGVMVTRLFNISSKMLKLGNGDKIASGNALAVYLAENCEPHSHEN